MANQRKSDKERTHQAVSGLLAEASEAFNSGNLRLGAQQLLDALTAEPHNCAVHLALGNLYLKTGRAPDAEIAFRSALTHCPDNGDAAAGLVKVRMVMGQLEEAESLSRSYLVQFPNDLVLGQLLAQILIDEKRSGEAISQLREVVASHPNAVAALNSLAKRLSEAGEFEESRQWFERATSVDRTSGFAYLGWVQTKTVGLDDQPMVQAMESALSVQTLAEHERMHLHFALGKAYGDVQEFRKSMLHYREANKIRDRSSNQRQPFKRDLYRSFFDITRQVFTKQAIDSRRCSVASTPTPIFVFGMFRSGTTLVEQILSSHSSVAAGGEIGYWMDRSAACFDHQRRTFDFSRSAALRKPYQKLLSELSQGREFVVDKMPGNYRLLGLLRILYPNAKFVHCRRHPVATCLSIYRTAFNNPPNYASDPEKLVLTYDLYRQTMEHWQSVLEPGAIHDICYEDLVDDAEGKTRELLQFCGLEFEESCRAPERNVLPVHTASLWQVRQPIYRSSRDKWRQYEPWLGGLQQLIEGDTKDQ